MYSTNYVRVRVVIKKKFIKFLQNSCHYFHLLYQNSVIVFFSFCEFCPFHIIRSNIEGSWFSRLNCVLLFSNFLLMIILYFLWWISGFRGYRKYSSIIFKSIEYIHHRISKIFYAANIFTCSQIFNSESFGWYEDKIVFGGSLPNLLIVNFSYSRIYIPYINRLFR